MKKCRTKSSVDPEATLSGKDGGTKSRAYKTRHAIDAESRVIVDGHVTTGQVYMTATGKNLKRLAGAPGFRL